MIFQSAIHTDIEYILYAILNILSNIMSLMSLSYIFPGHATPTTHGSHQRLAISPNPMQGGAVSAQQLTLGHLSNDYDPSVPLQKRFRGCDTSEPHHWTS